MNSWRNRRREVMMINSVHVTLYPAVKLWVLMINSKLYPQCWQESRILFCGSFNFWLSRERMNEWHRTISAKHRFHVVSFIHASACKLNHSRLNMYLILSHFLASSFPSIQFFFLIIRFIMCSTAWSGRLFASFSRVGPPKRQCSFLY